MEKADSERINREQSEGPRLALLRILQHSLGVDEYGQGAMFRNHYVAGGDDVAHCRELVALGFMAEHPASDLTGGDPLFTVTKAGRAAVREHSPKPPKLTRSQQRYLRFLNADCGLSFREWLKYDTAVPR